MQVNPWDVLRNYGWEINTNCYVDSLEGIVIVKGLQKLGKKLGLKWSPMATEVHWRGWIWKESEVVAMPG